MNEHRVAKILADLQRFQDDLQELKIHTPADLSGKEKFYAASMILFSIVNRAIDLGEELISAKSLGFPESYRDIIQLLERNKVIDEALGKDLSSLIHFRNLAAHEYHTFTKDDVYLAYTKVNAVNKLTKAVKESLK